MHHDIFEGLTELLAGYVLSKSHDYSYHNCWKWDGNYLCKMTYHPEAILWATFCSHVKLSETFPIYFYQENCDWNQSLNNFEENVKSAGYTKFHNPFNHTDESDIDQFTNECKNAFGEEEFESMRSNHARHIDFSLITL